ncbi:sugar-transfer associated ATP-grasp domain-containing protein [Tabrizicola sp.]|uniref:sugar-transfer associated ATP-grasp domain-containing protein n=1 Tax=Tabrizicola sp. TaxID=2005166 RepID=UPI00286C3FE1|nr:sugar-transfer associated ATP-grasp domain-containing protein [Tabrizicola sp.]
MTDLALTLPALTHKPKSGPKVDVKMIERVARSAGISPLRQFSEIVRLNRRDTHLGAYEYHRFQVYRRDLGWTEKRAFVGDLGSAQLNHRLAPAGLTQMRGFVSDKLAFTGLMAQLGLPTTRIQAAYATGRSFGALRCLRSEADVIRFLTHEARFPLFGKPAQLRQGLGAVRIDHVDGARGMVVLGNGRAIPLRQLAAEIAAHAATGYLFQDVVEQHADLNRMAGGSALATLRIVTVVAQADRPQVLYAAWRLPPPLAMIDDTWQDDSLISLVDTASGRLDTLRRGKGPDTEWLADHPLHREQVVGQTLPFWPAAKALAVAAHGVVPVNGILGWDIAIGPTGPVLIECNENTAHGIFQLAAGRGILNDDFKPVFAEVIARNARLIGQGKGRASAPR